MSEKLALPMITSAHRSPGVPRLTGGSVRGNWSRALAPAPGRNEPTARAASTAKKTGPGSLPALGGMDRIGGLAPLVNSPGVGKVSGPIVRPQPAVRDSVRV